jgi:exopolysaccharide production protein ExoQ
MSASVATIVFGLFIFWLFARDRALRSQCSMALWIPIIWIVIVASRPISSWLGGQSADPVNNLEGSPTDRLVFLILILAAFVVLLRRRVNWSGITAGNKWLCLYLIYLGISVVWCDYPFVSLKRWIKEVGNILMVLVILSEGNPAEALKSVLFRCCSFLVPMSVLYIKYYPDLGRYFDRWTWQYSYGGVTTDKNMLGMSLFLCGMGLCWSFLDVWRRRAERKKDVYAHLLLMVMSLWLWHKASSATSLACSLMGAALLAGMEVPAIRRPIQRFGLFALLIPFILVLVSSVLFNPLELVTQRLGRDMTLTGRTDIWQGALRIEINPLIGTGYCSFWEGERAERVSKDLGFFFQLKEAHNGYLDVYLNSGLIGLALVVALLISSVRQASKQLTESGSYAAFRYAVLVSGILYNITESALSGLVTLWVVLLLAIVDEGVSAETCHKADPVLGYDENQAAGAL